ncbi:hypothetical protein LTS17_002619 [Exophiala oligosperma]
MAELQHEKGACPPPIKIYPDKFAHHVVVITGSGSGIGEATARLFAQQGAQVVMLDIDEEKLRTIQASIIETAGHPATDIHICDVGDEQSVSTAVAETVRKFGKIDVLINVADEYRRTRSTNLDGSFYLTRAVLPYMQKAAYGRIIHTSSATFAGPLPGMTAYVASKAGIVGLVRAASIEAGPGVTINAVLPGLVETPGVLRHEGASELFDTVVAKQVVKRRGQPGDIAHTFSFIASPEAAFYTGQTFNCSGGVNFN